MKKIFVHKIEVFNSEILICVGVNFKDVVKWADKNSKNLKAICKEKDNQKIIEEYSSNSLGFVTTFVKDNQDFYFVWLKDYKNEWDYLDVLNHEITHLRQFLFGNKGIKNEIEFEAYFQENTFRQLRIRLNKFLNK